jgi:hypothetical protein
VRVAGAPLQRAMVVGIGKFDPPATATEPGPDAPAGFPLLHFAEERVTEVAKALQALGLHLVGGQVELDLQLHELQELLAEAAGDDRPLVAHVLSHGSLGEGSGSLRVAARDSHSHKPGWNVRAWLDDVEDQPHPSVLLLLDVCHAGAVVEAQWSAWQARLASEPEHRRAWVVSATSAGEKAYEGRFSRAVAAVLQGLRDDPRQLDVSEAVEFVPLAKLVRAVEQELARRSRAAGAVPQRVATTPVGIGKEPSTGFIPNPGYRPEAAARQRITREDALHGFVVELDPVLDAGHYLSRAFGWPGHTDPNPVSLFTGRHRELGDMARWLDGDQDPHLGLQVVTGSPGAGKSALLGVLVCAAHPQLRNHLLGHLPRADLPGRNEQLAAVHARGRQLDELLGSLARQLELVMPAGGRWTPVAFEAALAARAAEGNRPVIVLDALDEADRPKDVMDLLLLPLARARLGDGSRMCQLLVGTRPWEEFDVLLDEARRSGRVSDLDLVPSHVLRQDLAAYANRFLATSPLYDRAGMRPVREQLAATIATRLTADRPEGDREAAGAFLVAGLYVHHLLSRGQPITLKELPRIGQEVPLSPGAMLELHLAQLGGVWLRPVLAALAYGKHPGMPASLARLVAAALTNGPLDPQPAHPNPNEVALILDPVGFYLRRAVDVDGTTLYRLFHQGLADYLQRHPIASGEQVP